MHLKRCQGSAHHAIVFGDTGRAMSPGEAPPPVTAVSAVSCGVPTRDNTSRASIILSVTWHAIGFATHRRGSPHSLEFVFPSILEGPIWT